MTSCRASILIGQTAKPIKVLLSSGAATSYISDVAAANLGLDLWDDDLPDDGVTTIIKDAFGEQIPCHQTISIEILLGTFRHMLDVLVVPSNMPYLVLGINWIQRYNSQFDFGANTLSVTDDEGSQHVIKTKTLDSESIVMPSMTIVSRTKVSQNKKSKAFSRNRMVKEGWGSRWKFQASYGLTMSPEDIEEGNEILKMMERNPPSKPVKLVQS